MERTNIGPVLQMILGPAMAQVKTEEDYDNLIKALRELPPGSLPSGEEMAEIAKGMYSKKPKN